MFGYVLFNRKDADKEERDRYRCYYCGLCQALSRSYGKKGEKILSFDMTFLYLLLADLYNEEGERKHIKCTVHPVKGRDIITGPIAEYAADMQVLLSYFTAADSVADERSSKAEKLRKAFREDIAKLEDRYPVQFITCEESLEEQLAMERSGEKDILKLAEPSSRILGAIFTPYEDCWADKLRALGMALGRFIYILDAYDDLEKDEKKGLFNPLSPLKGDKDFKEKVRSLLEWAASDAALIMEKLPLDENLSILRNIIYSGIWARFEVKADKT